MSPKIQIVLVTVYVFALFLVSKGTATTSDLDVDPALSKICKETQYVDVCVSSVTPLLKGHKVDVQTVLKAAVKAASLRFKEAKKLVDKLAKDDTTPKPMVARLKDCKENFKSAIETLNTTKQALSNHQTEDLSHNLETVITYAETCTDSLNEIPDMKSPVSSVASDLSKVSSNSLAIAQLFLRSKTATSPTKPKGHHSSSKTKST